MELRYVLFKLSRSLPRVNAGKKSANSVIDKLGNEIWAATWDFQQCGMNDQQSLRSACAYTQSDQSNC